MMTALSSFLGRTRIRVWYHAYDTCTCVDSDALDHDDEDDERIYDIRTGSRKQEICRNL